MILPLSIINSKIPVMRGIILLVFLIHIHKTTSISINGHRLRIKLIPIDTLLFPENLTLVEKHQKLFEISRIRALNHKPSSTMISSTPSNSTEEEDELPLKNSTNAIWTPVRCSQGYYLSQMIIGSNQYSPYLIVDPGSDDTWVQCQGCTNCFPLTYGNFRYQQSSSFHFLPCNHPLCVPKTCQNNRCIYNNSYFGGSITKGWVLTDTLTFYGSRFSQTLVFGCGYDNRNLFTDPNNVIGGLMGLASGPRSILMQLADQTKRRFSYCLQPWNQDRRAYTFLNFGDDAKFIGNSSRKVQTTGLVTGIPRYYVNLVGITIEGRLLAINPTVFKLKPDHSGGFAIDVGCPYTILAEPAYGILKAGMSQYLTTKYQWHPMASRPQGVKFDLCYTKPSGRRYTLPSLGFHFEGRANLLLNSNAVFQDFGTFFCMGVSPATTPAASILGAFQQTNYKFLFDVSRNTMSFAPETCQVYT